MTSPNDSPTARTDNDIPTDLLTEGLDSGPERRRSLVDRRNTGPSIPIESGQILASLMNGKCAIVSSSFLERLIMQTGRSRVTAVGAPGTGPKAHKVAMKVGSTLAGERGIYRANPRQGAVRGRSTVQQVFHYLKSKGVHGVAVRQMLKDLSMPASTLYYALRVLQERSAVQKV